MQQPLLQRLSWEVTFCNSVMKRCKLSKFIFAKTEKGCGSEIRKMNSVFL